MSNRINEYRTAANAGSAFHKAGQPYIDAMQADNRRRADDMISRFHAEQAVRQQQTQVTRELVRELRAANESLTSIFALLKTMRDERMI